MPGIDVYMPAPQKLLQQQEVVAFDCPKCGATTSYDIAIGWLTCAYCGFHEVPSDSVVGRQAEKYEFTVETLQRAVQGWDTQRKELVCQNCAALTSVPPENLTHTCLFCGLNKVIQREAQQDIVRPRYLIPFKIEGSNCASIAQIWLGSNWMTPKALKQAAILANFTPIYLPFWTFSATTRASWKAEVGHQEIERYFENGEWKQRTITRWRWESGEAGLAIENLLVDGTQRLSGLLMGKIKNFDLTALVPYDPIYLAGLQAQAYDISLERAWEIGRQHMRESTRQACVNRASTNQVRNFSMHMDFDDESWRYILLPFYLNTYNFADKTYQIILNAQTGSIAGQRPADWNKIWLVIMSLLSPGIFLGLVGIVTAALGIGIAIGAIGFILLVIGLVFGVIIFTKAQSLDDA